jgi:RNA polymerase sigma-70 factor (ECF subfamily)
LPAPEPVPQDRRQSFVRLLALNQRSIYALILSLVPNWADADEILQETSLRLWEHFDRYVPGTDFGAWARTLAKFQVMTYRRKKGRQREQFGDEFVEVMATEAERRDVNSCEADRDEALSKCLQSLPEHSRELLRAYYAPGAVPHQVAQSRARTIEWLRLALFRIRRILRSCIEQRLGRQVRP